MMSEPRYPSELIERAEAYVSRIQGVSSCRISVDETGVITEIHVVASSQKPQKLVARDVETCLKATLGMDVDHRKISVAPVDPAQPGHPSSEGLRETVERDNVVQFPVEEYASRFEFQSVNLFMSQASMQAEVELVRDRLEVLGNAATTNLSVSPLRVVGEATLRAVGELLDDSVRLGLGEVQEIVLGDVRAVVVRVDLARHREIKSLAGCALFSRNINQTVVFATLDAVNRVLGKLVCGKSVEYRIK
jgi:hypothetical protein